MKSDTWTQRIEGRGELLWIRCGATRLAVVVEDEEPELLLARISATPRPDYRLRGDRFVDANSTAYPADPFVWCSRHRPGPKGHHMSLLAIAEALSRGRRSLGVADVTSEGLPRNL